MTRTEFVFPVGYHTFHKDQIFNYQLNRWYSLGYLGFEAVKEVGERVASFADWKAEMLKRADAACVRRSLIEAAFFYRAAEFYTFREDPDKEGLYDRFIALFYRGFEQDEIERAAVPYGDGALPAMRIPHQGGE